MFLINKVIYITLIFLVMVFNINAEDKLTVGMNAPDFQLSDQDNISRSLSDYQDQWLVLYFYPKDDTPGCTTEACSFRDNFEIMNKLNVSILGVSVDTKESHKDFAEKYSLPFPLLADTNGEVAKKYDSYGSFKKIHEALLENSYVFVFLGKGIHKIKKKAEQIASELSIKMINETNNDNN